MRQIKRIPIMLEVLKDEVNKRKVLDYWFKPDADEQIEIDSPYNDIDDIIIRWNNVHHSELYNFWVKNYDLRLTQLLITLNICHNYRHLFYYKEDDKTMIQSGVLEARDILFWGQNYNKDMVRLDETNWILIKDMSKGHIENLLLINKEKDLIPDRYIKAFEDELIIRDK